MSMIHRSSALLGRRSALMAGTARCRTVRSMTYSTHARAITARPIHSLRPALGGGEVSISGCIGFLWLAAVTQLDRRRPRNSSSSSVIPTTDVALEEADLAAAIESVRVQILATRCDGARDPW